MTRRIEIAFTVFFAFVLCVGSVGLAQPAIPKEKIPKDVPAKVAELIEGLYSQDPAVRARSANLLGSVHPVAEPAIPFLISLLREGPTAIPKHPLWQMYFPSPVAKSARAMYRPSPPDPAGSAAHALIKIGRPAVGPLIAAMEDDSAAVRGYSAFVLGCMRLPQADLRRDKALTAALADKHPFVRFRSAEALGRLRCSSAMDALLGHLRDPDPKVRAYVATALGRIQKREAVGPLIDALKDQDMTVRLAAALALGDLKAARAVEPLAAWLKETDFHLRKLAAVALGAIGDARAVAPLLESLKHKEAWSRGDAAAALGQIGDRRAVEPLIALLEDENYRPRMFAVRALSQIGDARAVEPLLRGCRTGRLSRRRVAEALGGIKDPRVVRFLVTLLRDKDKYVKAAAANALKEIQDPGTVGPFIKALKDRDIRCAAVVALGRLKDRRAVKPLIKALRDKNPWCHGAIARSLRQINDPDTVRRLTEMMKSHNVHHRRGAVVGLAGMGAACPLIAALKDKDKIVRKTAVMGLGGRAGDPRVAALIAALADEEPVVRIYAASSLGRLTGTRPISAVEPLINVLGDEDANVRGSAARALKEITGEDFGQDPEKWRRWWKQNRPNPKKRS